MFGLLAGLLAPSAGTILVDGHNPFAEFEWFRGKIGIVFQNDRLLPWRTAVENVEYGLELLHVDSSKRRRAALDWLDRSEEHTSELQSLMRIAYAVFCLQKKNQHEPSA